MTSPAPAAQPEPTEFQSLFEETLRVGEVVTFTGCSESQQNWAGPYANHNALLAVGETYWVSKVEVHTWHAKVWLGEGDLGPFNSVCFERVA